MIPGPPRRRRARPVGDAPVDALLGRSEDLAKGWLLALLEQSPLDSLPAILASELARDAPRLCDAIVRALADDTDLSRLGPGGALEPLAARTGELAGASTAEATMRAVDALQAVVWGGVREALPNPDPDQIAELAERLALVTEVVRLAALAGAGPAGAGTESGHAAEAGPRAIRPVRAEPGPGAAAPSVATPGPSIRTPEPSVPAPERSVPAPEPSVPAPEPSVPARESSVQTPEPSVGTPDRQALWVGALEEELVHSQRTGAHLSLLLAELEDADRMQAVEPPTRASAMFGRFAQTVRDAVRRQDILASESETRTWIVARDTGRAGAQALAVRIAAMVRGELEWRGAPLAVTIGISVLGEDGIDSESLIESAEEARFAAAASGVGVIADREPDPPSEPA